MDLVVPANSSMHPIPHSYSSLLPPTPTASGRLTPTAAAGRLTSIEQASEKRVATAVSVGIIGSTKNHEQDAYWEQVASQVDACMQHGDDFEQLEESLRNIEHHNTPSSTPATLKTLKGRIILPQSKADQVTQPFLLNQDALL